MSSLSITDEDFFLHFRFILMSFRFLSFHNSYEEEEKILIGKNFQIKRTLPLPRLNMHVTKCSVKKTAMHKGDMQPNKVMTYAQVLHITRINFILFHEQRLWHMTNSFIIFFALH